MPAGQIVFFRSFFAIFPIVVFLALARELRTAFHTTRPFSHIARGIVGVASMGLGFFALTRLPLPEAITLNYAQPLLVVVFSAIFLGEIVRVYRWSAVAIGLIGVVIVSWPKLTLFALGRGDGQSTNSLGVVAALRRRRHFGGRDAPGAQPRAHREDRHDRAVVLADGKRRWRCCRSRSAGRR